MSKPQPSHNLLPPMSSITNHQDSSPNRSSRMLLREAWIDGNHTAADTRNVADILAEALRISSHLRMVLQTNLVFESALDEENQEDSN